MKILIIHSNDICNYPPVKSLVENLENNGHEITIITRDSNNILEKFKDVKVFKLLPHGKTKLENFTNYLRNRKLIRKYYNLSAKENDVVWTTTTETVREVGHNLLSCNHHVMQMMELIEYEPYFPFVSIIKFNIKRYAQHAWKVVVPEKNRAYIQKAWWNLPRTPYVLPNKPYSIRIDKIPKELIPYIKKMKEETKKIILYQGVFLPDRNLDAVAKAISYLSDRYVLYIMGKENEYQKQLCEKYPFIVCVPFIPSPYHLAITKEAYIGLLPYVPKKVANSSILNALYCAPNKIYEYAACGLPMIGSDVLGLKEPFEKYNIGCCCDELDCSQITNALQTIETHYDEMSLNCKRYFNSIDLDNIVNSILSKE